MSLFSRRRTHLRAVDLAQVPDTGAPVVVHRSAGELIGAKVDEMVRAGNRVVDLQCELARAQEQLRQHQIELAEAVKELGMPPDVLERISRRGE